MSTRESWAFFRLHQAACWIVVLIPGSTDTDVASAFLHDDAENDTLLHTDLGGVVNGVEDTADVLAAVASLEHSRLVDVEESDEVFPCLLARKGRGWPREGCKAHLSFSEADQVREYFKRDRLLGA